MKLKKTYMILEIVLIIFVILLNGCSKQLSPEDTAKAVIDNFMTGNYENAFFYFVDADGNPLSQDVKQQFRASIEKQPISGYEIKGTGDLAASSPQYSVFKNSIFKEFKVISIIVTEKETKRTQEGKFIMVQYQEHWKVLMPKVQAPTVQPQANPNQVDAQDISKTLPSKSETQQSSSAQGANKIQDDLRKCEILTNQNEKDVCYTNVAYSYKEYKVCDNILMQVNNEQCKVNIAVEKQDLAVCPNLQLNWQRDYCYSEIAQRLLDASLCEKVELQGKDTCYNNIALRKEDIAICDKIQSESSRGLCYSDIAIKKLDVSICDRATANKDYCYNVIAKDTKDVSVCNKIKNQDDIYGCYSNVARAKQDTSICQSIPEQYFKDNCLKEVAQGPY